VTRPRGDHVGVSLGVRHDEAAPGRRAGGADLAAVPSAVRARPPGWRDPRLWVGLLIVALSVVGGSRLLAAADDTVAVWAVAADSGPGATLTSADLVVRRVRFADGGDLAAYYAADATLPSDLRLVRGVGAGDCVGFGLLPCPCALTTMPPTRNSTDRPKKNRVRNMMPPPGQTNRHRTRRKLHTMGGRPLSDCRRTAYTVVSDRS